MRPLAPRLAAQEQLHPLAPRLAALEQLHPLAPRLAALEQLHQSGSARDHPPQLYNRPRPTRPS